MKKNIDFLNIPGVITTAIENTKRIGETTRRIVTAAFTVRPETCGAPECCQSFVRHGRQSSTIKDTPSEGIPTEINLTVQRYKCKALGHTFSAQSSEINQKSRATNRSLDFVAFKALSRKISEITFDTGIARSVISSSANTIIDLMDVFYQQQAPRILGIDEVHVGGKARAVFTDIEKRQVIEIHELRSKKVIIETIKSWENLENIQYVTIDMYYPYRDAVHAAIPGATLIIDKRHVLEYARKAMEEERKKIWRRYHNGGGTLLKGRLKRLRQLINQRPSKLSAADLKWLDQTLARYPRLQKAYTLKERFNVIWSASDSEHAKILYGNWKSEIPEELIGSFEEVLSIFKNWGDEIFAYFDATYDHDGDADTRVTNAYTESANRLIKELFKQGRGNHDFWRLRAKVLHNLGPWTEDEIRDTIGIEWLQSLHHGYSMINVLAPVPIGQSSLS